MCGDPKYFLWTKIFSVALISLYIQTIIESALNNRKKGKKETSVAVKLLGTLCVHLMLLPVVAWNADALCLSGGVERAKQMLGQ